MDKILSFIAPFTPLIIMIFLSRSKTKKFGHLIGRVASKLLRQKFGKEEWEKKESRIQTTIGDFVAGLMEGLDKDEQ